MDMNMNPKLLPCPFCGYEPELEDGDCLYPLTRDKTEWNLVCYEPDGCSASVFADTPEKCIERWNTRNKY
jgi:hypothetical protein